MKEDHQLSMFFICINVIGSVFEILDSHNSQVQLGFYIKKNSAQDSYVPGKLYTDLEKSIWA